MSKVFIDTDVILDVLLDRVPHSLQSAEVLLQCEKGKFKGITSALILANIHYILTRMKIANVDQILLKLEKILYIATLSREDILSSIASDFADFEDGVQNAIALREKCDALITRNTADFSTSVINVLHPDQFLLHKGSSRIQDPAANY